MMIVPIIPPAALSPLLIHLVVPEVTSHENIYFTSPTLTVVSVFASGHVPFLSVTILLFGMPKRGIVQLVSEQAPRLLAGGFIMTDTMISPNDRARPTRAGTNASPMNSLSSKVSLFSFPQKKPSPMTYFSVMSGENIA